jgi:hypothetical protein
MGAIDRFLGRWGYARLDQYGLILTPEGRVMSTRPAVLDDGLGGRIVGWQDGDLAAMELDHFGEPKPKQPISPPPSLSKLPAPAPKPQPMAAQVIAPAMPMAAAVVAPPAAPVAAQAARALPGVGPLAAPTPVKPQAVAAEPEVDEDDWEWQIAMARGRAAAEEVEVAREDLLGAQAVIAAAVIPRKTSRGVAAPSPGALDLNDTTQVDPMGAWPKTEPLAESFASPTDPASPKVFSPVQKTLMVATSKRVVPAPERPTTAGTVIPVPQLPRAADPRLVRPAPNGRRVARGTIRQAQATRNDTVVTSHDDKTSPYIELPAEVKPSGFAHTKRVASKQR